MARPAMDHRPLHRPRAHQRGVVAVGRNPTRSRPARSNNSNNNSIRTFPPSAPPIARPTHFTRPTHSSGRSRLLRHANPARPLALGLSPSCRTHPTHQTHYRPPPHPPHDTLASPRRMELTARLLSHLPAPIKLLFLFHIKNPLLFPLRVLRVLCVSKSSLLRFLRLPFAPSRF